MKSITDWKRVRTITEKEIRAAASSDPDSPLLTKADLKKFKRVQSLKTQENPQQ